MRSFQQEKPLIDWRNGTANGVLQYQNNGLFLSLDGREATRLPTRFSLELGKPIFEKQLRKNFYKIL
jgi:hypothetical protein